MNTAVIILGGNMGNIRGNLEQAKKFLAKEAGTIINLSGIYQTKAWGNTGVPDYLNQVVVLSTGQSPTDLMEILLSIEKRMGRVRREKWESRPIDLDILYFNSEVINLPGLTIPHRHLHERRFVLEPLNEILPGMIHPVLKRSNSELLSVLADTQKVQWIGK